MITPTRPAELDLTNWDLGGPVSEWSYRHADELFPTVRLTPGRTSAEFQDHGEVINAGAANELADDLGSGLVSAITVMAGGCTVFRWPDHPAQGHLLMSVSKVFASLTLGLLADRGDVDYAHPVRDYLPELGRQWQQCRVQHVLDMTSGIDCPEVGDPGAYSDPGHPFYQFEASLGWRPAARSKSPYDLVRTYGRSGPPGTRYEYTSANTFLVAWIIERVTGLRYAEALQRLLWDQLTLARPAAICVNHAGVAVAHGGLIMSVDDLARFGTLFTPSQPAEPHAINVPASYLDLLRTPRHHLTPQAGSWPAGSHPGGQWNLIYPDGDLYKSGFGGQGLYVSPDNDVVIAFAGVPGNDTRTHQLARKCRTLAANSLSRKGRLQEADLHGVGADRPCWS